MLNASFLHFLCHIVDRCAETRTELSFCGEDAGRPIEALTLAAIGFRTLSMRPASIGPVKHLIRRVDLKELRAVIEAECEAGVTNVRSGVINWLAKQDI
jgi:phosphotransferase system enzyme I (PtsP)